MDFKVKSQLLPLLFSGGMAAAQAQTVLQQDTHMFREGDVILKQEVQYKSPGRWKMNIGNLMTEWTVCLPVLE